MAELHSLADYFHTYGHLLENRVLEQFPPLQAPGDPLWPGVHQLKRKPFPAQTIALMSVIRRWEQARCAAVIAECGTGKTLVALGSIWTAARGRHFTALAMVPPQLLFSV
jgi:superfamily II DNA or RNA helicase